jgi:hypothetical protein
MPSLNRDHRRLLENTVVQARGIAEEGAHKVLTDQYAVHHHEPWQHMTPEERELRNQLRAHGRQLGDRRDDSRDTQEIDHLVQACAYEHWHRMLFARFLAENDLLLDADHGMAMTLEEVRELAREQNREWIEIAAELAQKMLLAVFRPDDPVLRVSLPPETRQKLEGKLDTLPAEVFQADDSLGWVYQFWQRDQKDRVNKSEVKIGADELPAVTQLFTEDYMVLFLLENTLGAWWTAKRRAEGKDSTLPGYEWTYLRLNEDGSPAAGSFESWPRAARELRVLDPSMGSGHFLVFALPILARMRMDEEGLSIRAALATVITENLFGLELDARCAQIAAFNLALAAWRLEGQHFSLPRLNLACSGLGIHASEADWVELAGQDGLAREEMRRLYSLFKDAPTLGSLIDPLRLRATVYSAGADHVLPLIEEALHREQTDDARELAIAAQGVLAGFRILASLFTLVATNVPYLGRGNQDPVLSQYCTEFHSDAKADLATCFVDRCLHFCRAGGSVALVTPQNWLFLTSYRKLRERLLANCQWDFVLRLGSRAFEMVSGEVVNVSVLGLTHKRSRADHQFVCLDVSEAANAAEKAAQIRASEYALVSQTEQLRNPDARITLTTIPSSVLLGSFAEAFHGQGTFDSPRFSACFWEIPQLAAMWVPQQSTPAVTQPFGGCHYVLRWESGNGALAELMLLKEQEGYTSGKWKAGVNRWGSPGVIVGQMGDLPATLYLGFAFDENASVVIPNNTDDLPAVWSFVTSPQFRIAISNVDQSIKVTCKTLVKVPFDRVYWQAVATQKYPEGLPKTHSWDPTQWIFDGHPEGSEYPLQVAVARLVGYRWPRQSGSTFPGCPALGVDAIEAHTDIDGIVPINPIAGESSAGDRLRTLLADAYGEAWSATKLRSLIADGNSLETWLCDCFFEEHCRVFQHRPFVWHVWDGRKDGFHALVNYHKLVGAHGEGRKTLEKLIYTYLGRWIERQNDEIGNGKEGADARLVAAMHLKTELERILAGEKPYDLFVRWKPLYQQPIGWAPDINDGVRLNIRPWLNAKPYQPGRRDSCILRVTPRMNYGKDRGKEPQRPKEDFPWFWSWDEQSDDFLGGKDFDGARWNDLHYSLETKRNARLRAQAKGSSK